MDLNAQKKLRKEYNIDEFNAPIYFLSHGFNLRSTDLLRGTLLGIRTIRKITYGEVENQTVTLNYIMSY